MPIPVPFPFAVNAPSLFASTRAPAVDLGLTARVREEEAVGWWVSRCESAAREEQVLPLNQVISRKVETPVFSYVHFLGHIFNKKRRMISTTRDVSLTTAPKSADRVMPGETSDESHSGDEWRCENRTKKSAIESSNAASEDEAIAGGSPSLRAGPPQTLRPGAAGDSTFRSGTSNRLEKHEQVHTGRDEPPHSSKDDECTGVKHPRTESEHLADERPDKQGNSQE